ncbi:MAG: hypothetical protein Q8S04_06985, partial [Bacteroidales bacterium]|nr:hypothetical protein [Bacteroidales bacterium]
MRVIYYLLIATAVTLSSAALSAQQKIDPTLEVKRDFDAKLMEITKGKLYSSFADSLGIFNLSFKYTIFDKPIKDLYEFTPLPSATIERSPSLVQPVFYLKAGSNFPLNPYGNFYLQPRLGKGLSLIVNGGHNSFMDKLPGILITNNTVSKGTDNGAAPSSASDLGIRFKYSWEKGEIGADAGVGSYRNSYYGINETTLSLLSQISPYPNPRRLGFMKDSLSNSQYKTRGKFYSRSINKSANSLYYDFDIAYSQLKAKAKFYEIGDFHTTPLYDFAESQFNEKYINTGLVVGGGFSSFNKILAGVRYEASNLITSDSYDRSNLEIHPKYIFNKGRLNLDLGFKYNLWRESGTNGYNIYFSGSASYELVKGNIWLYGLLDGKNNFMNYHKMADLNPWIHPAIDIMNIEQPVIARAGIKGKFRDRVSFNIYGGYYEFLNQIHFYANNSLSIYATHPSNSFGAIYRDEKRVGIGGEILIKLENFEGGIDADFYGFRDENNMTNKHYNYSPFELKGRAKYSWRDRVVIGTDFHHKQKSPALFIEDLLIGGVP